MLKRLALVVLMSISSLSLAQEPTVGLKPCIKQGRVARVWKNVIVPKVGYFCSFKWMNNDNTNSSKWVAVTNTLKWVSVFAGLFAWEYWLKTRMYAFANRPISINRSISYS